MRWLDTVTNSIDMSLNKLWEIVEDRGAWHSMVHRVANSWTQLSKQQYTDLFEFFKKQICLFKK